MKDNYKAQDLKFYARNEEEAKQFQERAFELGYRWTAYGKQIKHLNSRLFILREHEQLYFKVDFEDFTKLPFKQITLEEFLAPQRGEMVEVKNYNFQEWKAFEFMYDLGYGFDERYVVRDKYHDGIYYHFEQMRPIKNEQPKQEPLGMFKAFDETIELLEQAIDGLKKIKP